MENPDLVMIQETKVDEEKILGLGKNNWRKKDGIAVSTRGASGGLATLWNKNFFELHGAFTTQHWIYTELTHHAS